MTRPMALVALLATVIGVYSQSTPVIGGGCKIGMADVQIGGKQTQFFLKCEAASDSPEGEGVWVVKSRAASPPATENVQHRPAKKPANPNICEQDNGSRESDSCAVSAMCLQADQDNRVNYLQCDQTSMRWVKKSCQDTFVFNFEQQTCIIPRKLNTSPSRQQAVATGLTCTFSSCSNSNPCSVGTCNNGYCCSSGGQQQAPAIIVAGGNGGCNGCNQQQQPIIIASCPSGGYPVGQCSSGYCSPGYQCVSGSCCPSYSAPAPQVQIYTCPSGGSAVGACISGACATGYTCMNGGCCPQTTTKNPFVCPDGTQAVGGCVNGKCGTGYTCSNGLCCAGTSTSVRCLDGSEAVGACIPSCQGNACGGSQLTYYCGSGYTCTTGNICCPVQSCPDGGSAIGPTVNGLCPTGYNAQNGICCSNMCADGSAGSPPVNQQCPTGLTLVDGVCCSGANTLAGFCGPTPNEQSIGSCTTAGSCGGMIGYACDMEFGLCCPAIDFVNRPPLGPAVAGMCPGGYMVIYNPNNIDDTQGSCYDLALIPGGCDGTSIGPCSENPVGQCEPSSGATCYLAKNQCCPPAAFRRIKPSQRKQSSAFGRSLASYMPPRDMTCPDGSSASGGCMNGLCGLGMECVNGLCCPPQQQKNSLSSRCPNGQSAVSGCFGDGSCGTGFECVTRVNLCCPPGGNNLPPTPPFPKPTIQPIGGRCFTDEECVGNGEGLSLCHAGVCQCSPIAYSQGIACIRRRAMVMNDEPMDAAAVETNEVTKTA